MRFVLTVLFSLFVTSVQAINIEQVVSPKLGIKAWLVESTSLPMVNIEVAFRAGGVFENSDKNGVTYLTASLIDEGAAEKNSKEFTEALEDIGALFYVRPSSLMTTLSLRTLSEHKQTAFALLSDAITKPRFDKEAFERIKDAVLSNIKASNQSPGSVAMNLLKEHLYANHPYGKPLIGTNESVSALKISDVKSSYKKNFTIDNMTVSVVGDIKADELANYLDQMFVGLAKGNGRNTISKGPVDIVPVIVRETMDVPQSSIFMAHLGINREDKDYYASYAMNYILGGGGFNSRLMEEIREKRGLAYSVYSYFNPMPIRGSFIAAVSTKNRDAATSINLIKKEMARIKKDGVTDKEYAGAMSYLKGSFPLRLDSSSKIIGYLTTMQMENLGIDYLDNWTKRIEAVSKADMQRVANRLLHEDEMVTIIVGKLDD